MKKTKTLVASLIAIVVCFAMLLGTTFAWFTDSTASNNNIIASGTLNVNAYWMEGDKDPSIENNWIEFNGDPIFNYSNWEPGYVEAKHIKIANEGSLAFKYKLIISPNGAVSELADVIEVYYLPTASKLNARSEVENGVKVGTLADLIADPDGAAYGILLPDGATPTNENEVEKEVAVTIAFKLPETVGNEYKGLSIGSTFDIVVYATQYSFEEDTFGNDYDQDAEYPAEQWDGTIDTSWYDPSSPYTEYYINTAEELAGLAKLVDGLSDEEKNMLQESDWDGLPVDFTGKTITLQSDIDLLVLDDNGEPVCFDPIGSYRFDKLFKGTFDGQGHTISNLNQNTWALNNGYYYNDCGLGLFGSVLGGTIKNLVMDGANISGESGLCGTIAAVAENATFENITVINSNVADYQYYAGGIVGWASGEINVISCNIDASTTIGAQWGEFNNANGGVIGGAGTSATIYLKDCTIACRIDAFNDVTSAYEWYSYRRSGMIIGDTGAKYDPDGDNVGDAVAPQLTCENVTVIYGDWANYHYCQFKNMNYPWVRVEAGTSTGEYSNPRYGHPTDANGNEVVDDNHVHNDGEKHHELIVFDQLYGGTSGDRYCTYGTATHDGVKVIYNNK